MTTHILSTVGGVHFSETITLGSIILGLILGLAGLGVLGYGARWKAAYETEKVNATALAEGREAFRSRSDRLEQELKDAVIEASELKGRVQVLERATDLTMAVTQMHDEHTTILRGIEHLASMLKHMGDEFPLDQTVKTTATVETSAQEHGGEK